MKRDLGFYGAFIGCTTAAITLVSQPVWAAETQVTGIRLNPTPKGFELVFDTQGDNRPPIFTVDRGNSSISDINNTQLRLPGGGFFRQANPAPGVTSVEVTQLDGNTIRVTVNGQSSSPVANVIRRDISRGLVLSFEQAPNTISSQTPPLLPGPTPPATTGRNPNSLPPFQPRAVAPPLGDIAIAPVNVTPDTIDLNSSERIPRLLLREAPVREVLTLLARAAGVNVAFAEDAAGATPIPGAPPVAAGPTISLDIENESVQDVFNYVLQITGLQANKVGNTVFVGKTLPNDAQNRVVRTLRLNQIKATLGKVSQEDDLLGAAVGGSVSRNQTLESATTSVIASGRQSISRENIKERGAKEVLESYGANAGATVIDNGSGEVTENPTNFSATLLNGLEAVADSRLNTITLIGTPRKVELATSLLKQLDLRKRQVAVNIKFIDINLLRGRNANADLSFQSGNFNLSTIGNFVFGYNSIGQLAERFVANISQQINDQNAKILTNPTLLVQEGNSAQVNLTEQVFTGFRQVQTNIATPGGGTTTGTTLEPIIQNAGVILNVSVDRIDDNGFITLDISPEVSSLSGRTFTDQFGSTASLLQQRRLESGEMRLRDGQTLVLTGIIQDADRVDVRKVPILGDIPLLGRLFRRDNRSRSRSELVVLVTPQILNDSEQSTFGYQYTPSPAAQRFLKR